MCGIFGRLATVGTIPDPEPLIAATSLLLHRGPDEGGWWWEGPFFLGHRRLAIIDLAQGHQPMASPDGRYVVVFNGEIYNYIELREALTREGYRFRTQSDTEVLLNGYHAWGVNLPRYLVGMFAFGIADRIDGSLYLARDRFGEKPLFVHESSRAVTFASELGPLISLPDVEAKIDEEALGGYLCLNYVPGDRTLVQAIRRTPPASWSLYSRTGVRCETYWTPPVADRDGCRLKMNDVVPRLQHLLDEAVHIALRSDVPVALFLSGGIDSSVIAASAVRQGRLKHAYCVDFAERSYSEFSQAEAVARALGLELRRVRLTAAALEDFFHIVEHADDPLADSSVLPTWTLSREAARDYKVVLTGDGGDELFGGYLTYKATALHSRFVSRAPMWLRQSIAQFAQHIPVAESKVSFGYRMQRFLRAASLPSREAHFTWNGAWLPKQASRLLKTTAAAALAARAITELTKRHGLPEPPDLNHLQHADVAEYLPNDILTKVDRMTMAHGLEARAPFLIPTVAEFGLKLPEHFKLTVLGRTKRILRELASATYGDQIARRRKQGFSIPIHQWLRGPARHLTEDLLAENSLREVDFLEAKAVTDARDQHLRGRAQLGFELWGLMVLVAWYRARMRTRPAPRAVADSLRPVVFPLTA
ncbi:MAG: asparagine synthase (glutamine-hydrolyzing) [Chromatiales bacterium]